jgi:hypothetical protein
MGAKIELNTMLRLGKDDVKPAELIVGKTYLTKKDNIRIYPMDLAILLLSEDWTAQGYCAIHKSTIDNGKMEIYFEVLSLFSYEEQKIITATMLEGLKKCGYL